MVNIPKTKTYTFFGARLAERSVVKWFGWF
jgi:hypothetical protein